MAAGRYWIVAMFPLLLLGCSRLPFASADDEALLEGGRWQWTSGGTTSMPTFAGDPVRYTLQFRSEYRVEVRADCNRGIGPWGIEGGKIKLGPLSMSRRTCGAGSRGIEFQAGLEAARRWYIRDGALFLELPGERGTLHFARAAPTASP